MFLHRKRRPSKSGQYSGSKEGESLDARAGSRFEREDLSDMSLAINIDALNGVLLADGWNTVADKSCDIDSYGFSGRKGGLKPMRRPD